MKRKPPKKPLPIRPVPEKVLEQASGGSTERRGGGWDANHNHKRLRVEPRRRA